MGRVARTVAATAATAGGLALGFLGERLLLHRRLTAVDVDADGPVLGSLAGEQRTVAGPDGTRIAVETYGPSGAPTLVLVHGWMCTGRIWHAQVAALADRYRIVTFDLPGHGGSTPPASTFYDLDLLGDTLKVVLEQEAGTGPAVLAGHSLGGMAVLNALGRHRDVLDGLVGGVVLLSTTSRARPEKLTFELGIQTLSRLERGIRRIVPILRAPRFADLTHQLYGTSSDLSTLLVRLLSVGPQADPRITAFMDRLARESHPDIVLGLAEAIVGVDVDAGFDGLRAPVTIMVGSHDRLTPRSLSERMARVADADLHVLDRVGHLTMLEAPREVNAVLEERLRRAAGTRSRPRGSRPHPAAPSVARHRRVARRGPGHGRSV